jgi:Virulence factor membrane-bound polymerase, C-terminal/Protein glycosylation ligase
MTLLLGLLVLSVGWLVPGHYVPWMSFQQEWTVAAGAALIGIAAALSAGKHHRWPWAAVLVLGIAGIPPAQWLAGQIRFLSDAVLASLYLCGFALAVVGGAALARTRREDFTTGLFGAFLAAGIVSVGMAATQWLQLGPISFIDGMARGGRAYANLAQPNQLASLLALAVVALLWMYETRRIGAFAACLAAAWLGAGIVMTQSRTGWMFLIAIAATTLWARRNINTRIGIPAVAVGAAFFVAMVVAWSPVNEVLLLSGGPLEARLQPGTRGTNWTLLAGAALESPWVGYGWGQVRLATLATALTSVFPEAMLLNGHNLILDLVLWNGMPLGLLIALALSWVFLRHFKACRSADHWLLLLGVTALVIHAMLEYPLEYAYFLLPLGLMLGALEGISDDPRTVRLPRFVYSGLLTIAIALLGWTGVEYMKVEESARQIRFVMLGIGLEKVPSVPPPDVTLLTAPREYHRFWVTSAREGMSPAELEWMRSVAQRYPSPPALLRYALAAGLNGRPQEAIDTLVQICFMHTAPRCSEGRDSWAALQKQHPGLAATPFPARALQALNLAP